MHKNIKLESFKYRFLIEAQSVFCCSESANRNKWHDFVRDIEFCYEKGEINVEWKCPKPGRITAKLDEVEFYIHGDKQSDVCYQRELLSLDNEDQVKIKNALYFKEIVKHIVETICLDGYIEKEKILKVHDCKTQTECKFHDEWAKKENIDNIDVRASNEVCTAPEMRYITQSIGNIKGKRLLDIGSGLGEASVYFAILGADVVSSDLSPEMMNVTMSLANANGVSVKQHIADAENIQLPKVEKFDIVYAGNLLHHVDIEKAINRIKPHIADGGMFISWDPLFYNPAISLYRRIATNVRTSDEHPLKWSDIQLFRKHFEIVETRYFWLTSLLIFVIMALVQRRNPNKERFWKSVVQEGEKWRRLYMPLEKLDKFILAIIPPLRMLCWNVVVRASLPKKVDITSS